MRVWKSPDGKRRINLDLVTHVCAGQHDAVYVFMAGDTGDENAATLRGADGESFVSALDAISAPPDPGKIDALIGRLQVWRGGMGTVGGNALVEIVRDIALAIKGAS